VVVARGDLPAGARLTTQRLAVRRVPARYAPAAAARGPGELLGQRSAVPVASGGYLTQATITGTAAANKLTGTAGDDVIAALGGDDSVGAGGNDICGGSRKDSIAADSGNDYADGGGNDKVRAMSVTTPVGCRNRLTARRRRKRLALGRTGLARRLPGNTGTDTADNTCERTSGVP
jgi:Ca2+-binding RTX toxin-like protein